MCTTGVQVVERNQAVGSQERVAFTLNEISEMLGVSLRTVQRLAADGEIETVQIGPRRYVPASYVQAIRDGDLGEVAD